MPFGFHPIWLAIILIIVLIVFGPGKLPELGGALGKGIREFRKASDSLRDEVMNSAGHNSETAGAGTVQPTIVTPAEATTHPVEPAAPVATPPADPKKP